MSETWGIVAVAVRMHTCTVQLPVYLWYRLADRDIGQCRRMCARLLARS